MPAITWAWVFERIFRVFFLGAFNADRNGQTFRKQSRLANSLGLGLAKKTTTIVAFALLKALLGH